jgi:RNA polymerase sigma-70 factor (ECF subfamily)
MADTSEHPLFHEIPRDLTAPLLRYLVRYVGARSIAEELLQETFLRINRGLPSFAGRSSVKTWAFAIASRVAADYVRRPEQKVRIVELTEAEESSDVDRTIDEQLIVDEMNTCVRQVIANLPDTYRTPLILHELEGLSVADIAEICACSVPTAKIRIHRARLRLKKALESQCEFYRDPESVFRCDRKA